jgi:ubiquinone/menaquinone biosynthesis C-methylase UbiE
MLNAGQDQRAQFPKACFLSASAQFLPFKENSFDLLMCTIAIHHFPLPLLALNEFKRVLRSGGKIIIADVCRDRSIGIWVWDRLHRWFEKGHVKYYRTEEMLKMLNNVGFYNVKMSEINPQFSESKKIFRKVGIFQAKN